MDVTRGVSFTLTQTFKADTNITVYIKVIKQLLRLQISQEPQKNRAAIES